MDQLTQYLVCQFCGRMTARGPEASAWLNQPHRYIFGVRVVRCPAHISEWALRHTREGRTGANRELARRGRELEEPEINPYAEPFPFPPLDE